jgi:hypothetical protein
MRSLEAVPFRWELILRRQPHYIVLQRRNVSADHSGSECGASAASLAPQYRFAGAGKNTIRGESPVQEARENEVARFG